MKVGNIEVYGIIYKITNKVNGKIYIGQTTRGFNKRYHCKGVGIERVYNYYIIMKRYEHYNIHLLRSIEKYGFNAFDVIEIFDVAFSKNELDIKEKLYIEIFDCIENGYNVTKGGDGVRCPCKKKTKFKIGEANKGKLLGEANPMYGKKRPKEIVDKIIESNKRRSGEKHALAKCVYVYSKDMKLLISFKTIKDTAEWLVENGFCNTINNARCMIRRKLDSDKIYKGLYFYHIKKENDIE